MAKYTANPKDLKNHTQSIENSIHVGKRSAADFLPGIFQTETNKRFFGSTLDQLLSSGSTETLDTYWGKISGKSFTPGIDLYNPEHSARRVNYQLAPGTGVTNREEITDGISYINTLNNLDYFGADTSNIDTLMSEKGYTLNLPIDVDMFVNHNNYFWLSDHIPICVIEPTAGDPIDIDDIVSLSNYTTPTLANGKTIEFVNGLRVQFTSANATSISGDYETGSVYIVEGVGSRNIKLIQQMDSTNKIIFNTIQPYSSRVPSDFDADPWSSRDWDYSEYKNLEKEYIVANRSSTDKNAWARVNQWYSIYAIRVTADYNDLNINEYTTTANRGVRPIICFDANIELFDHGKNPLADVEHCIVDLADPAADIVGQTEYNSITSSITTDWDSLAGGHTVGDKVFKVVGLNTLYFECVKTHGTDLDPTDFANNEYWTQLFGQNLEDGDRILFLNSDATYSDNIYEVSGVGTSIVLTDVTGTLSADDKVLVIFSNEDEYSGNEFYWNGSAWVRGQQHEARGAAPLFQLYDYNGTKLDNYTDNDFTGSKIWTYSIATAGVVDSELGFAPKYNDESSSSDFEFSLDANNTRYTQNLGSTAAQEINGMYFFKDNVTGKYKTEWAPVRENQRTPILQTTVVENETSVTFNLGTTEFSIAKEYTLTFENGSYRFYANLYNDVAELGNSNPTIVFQTDTDYVINDQVSNSHDIEFVDPYGNALSGVTVTSANNTHTINVSSSYEYSTIMYRSTFSSLVTGIIYINDNNHNRVRLYKNGTRLIENTDYTISGSTLTVTGTVAENDVFELSYIANEEVANAVYDVAPVHKYNPTNENLETVYFSNIYSHFEDQLLSMPGFSGNVFGENNYHKTARIENYGGTVREQIYSPSKFSYLSNNNATNPINAIVSTANDYQNFKNLFKTKIRQVWNSYSNKTVHELVDLALQEIHVGKNSDFKYAHSDMAYYENMNEKEITIVDTSTSFDMGYAEHVIGDKKTHVQVFLYEYDGTTKYIWKPLVEGTDYTIDVNQITLTSAVTLDATPTPATLKIRVSTLHQDSFIPPSAVKLGFCKPRPVEIVSGVLYGHDGSTHTCDNTEFYDIDSDDFDVISAALLDLELRISNNLIDEHANVVSTETMLPNPHNATGYEWSDLTSRLDDWYNRWAVRNSVTTLNDATYFDNSDKFTWNYSSVAPYIGGWQGIYMYYFGTTRPHTHPWEMLGHKTEPSWWNATYSWNSVGQPAKYAALIKALRTGLVGDPAGDATVDIRYARSGYDWDNQTLVTNASVLNDPITAGVVADPGPVNRSADFEFGDWGPVEATWRQTSEYKFALLEVMLQLKPYRTHETTWKLNHLFDITTVDSEYTQTVHKTINGRCDLQDQVLHNNAFVDGIIYDITMSNVGSSYTTATASVWTSLERTPALTTRVASGEITGIALTSIGEGYRNNFNVDISGDGTGAVAVAEVKHDLTETVLGLNNAIVEWSSGYGITTATIRDTLNNVESLPMIHIGGYTDKNILNISIDSSYQKGRVSIPSQDYSILLQKSSPVTTVFYSGVKITKGSDGYTVEGFDQNNRTFTTANISAGGKSFSEPVGNVTLVRYANFLNTTKTVPYKTTFLKRQELYNFLLELGHYYSVQGFDNEATWQSQAKSVIEWTLDIGDGTYYINGISDTLTYTQGEVGYVDNLSYIYDGTANLIDADNKQIKASDLLVLRNDETTEFSLKDTTKEIFGLRVNVVEYEHVIALNSVTQFNDLVHDPVTGVSQVRLRLEGERTRNWNGRIEAPGYLVRTSGIVTNIESSVREIEKDTITSESKILNKLTRESARFNTGYSEPTYLSNTFVEDNAAYSYGKGLRKYKGTPTAVDAIMRNKNFFGIVPTHTTSEEWMIRLGDYGDVSKRKPLEIQLDPALIKTNPQAYRFNQDVTADSTQDLVVDIHKGSSTLVHGDIDTAPFSTLPIQYNNNTSISTAALFSKHNKTAGLPLITETDYTIASIDDIADVYDSDEDYANISNWSSVVAYQFGDKVRYEGKVYQLTNVNGTGLVFSTDPITAKGTQIYPVVASGSTVIIDGNTVTFNKTTTSTSYNTIVIEGTVTNPTTEHGYTLLIDGTTITFDKTQNVTVYNYDIQESGTVGNPTITGSATASITIDGTTVNFNDTTPTTTNITAQTAFENAFNSAFATGSASTATISRVSVIEALRTAYIAAYSDTDWTTWINDYFTASTAGVDISYLLSEHTAHSAESWIPQLENLITNDVLLVNNVTTQSYNAANVIAGTETVLPAHITSTQSAIAVGTYIGDVATWLSSSSNANTTFALTTVVDTVSGSVYNTYDLTGIISKITSAGISGVTADADGSNQLRLTSTNATMVISASSTNADIGFDVAGETFTSTTSTSVVGDTLTTLEIVNQINNAGISNVAAYYDENTDFINITSTNTSINIGSGIANSDIGLNVGVTNATSNVTNVLQDLEIADIIDQINAASISGVTAENVNNTVSISSTNTSMVIGSGTANTAIGLTAETITSPSDEIVANTFDIADWEQIEDPATFSVWVLDNIGTQFITNTRQAGYNVYQVLDFDFDVESIESGVAESGDNALVTLNQDHNLAANDIVLLLNTTSTPAINGIHRVTDVGNDTQVYIDEFIETAGYEGKLLVLRPMRVSTSTATAALESDTAYNSGTNGLQNGMIIYVDDINDSGSTNIGGVFSVSRNGDNSLSFNEIRRQEGKADNTKISNAIIYDAVTNTNISELEVFDPAKGIIPGFVDLELDYKQDHDFAVYNNTTDITKVTVDGGFWGEAQAGQTWWDLSTAVYIDYEQSDIDYKQSYWGKLFPTATIDVYEWTRSNVIPEEYAEAVAAGTVVNGVELTGEPYTTIDSNGTINYYWSEEIVFDNNTNQEVTYFYFWVKNKTTVPTRTRNYSVTQLASILEDPTNQGVEWVAAISNNTVLVTGLESRISSNNAVLQINFANSDTDLHREYILLAENAEDTIIPGWLHMGLRDSIAKFDRSTMTSEFTTWNSTTTYSLDDVVKHSGVFYIALGASTNQDPSTDTTMDYWRQLYNVTENPSGVYTTDVVEHPVPKSVPDITLHEFNRYGAQVRPRQSWIKDVNEARRVLIDKLNVQLATINLIDTIKGWDTTLNSTITIGAESYDISQYWSYIDWVSTGHTSGTDVDRIVDLKSELDAITDATLNELVLVRTSNDGDNINRQSVYKWDGSNWSIVYKERATIKFNNLLWDFQKHNYGWDIAPWDYNVWDDETGVVFAEILDTIRNNIFIGQYLSYYADMWFTMLNYINSEQTNLDWAFKTTYIKLAVEYALDQSSKKFFVERTDDLVEYINSIKPFHTKLREYKSQRTASDSVTVTVSDSDVVPTQAITLQHNDVSGSEWTDLTVDGGTFTAGPDNADTASFTTLDSEYEYVYNANMFVQPDYHGWAPELFPADFREGLELRVQTNTSSSTEDANTRSFRIFIDTQDQYEMTVIEDSKKTTLASPLGLEDVIIELVDASVLFNPIDTITLGFQGVVYIGKERITYRSIVGNTLYGCTRATGGTSYHTHEAGDTVIDASVSSRFAPILHAPEYVGQLTYAAFNDSGKSLLDPTSVNDEAQFIQSSDPGTI